MSAVHASEHEWFRAALADRLLELLDEPRARRFDAHAAECAACAALLAAARARRADWWEGTGHVPAATLALLAEDVSALPASVEPLVREHLAHCEACRRDLAELTDAVAAPHAVAAPLPRRAWNWREWGLGAAAGVIFTAVVALLLARTTALEPRAVVGTVSPQPASAPPALVAAPSPPALARLAPPLVLAAAERGASADTARLAPAADATLVPLALPSLFLAAGTLIDAQLVDAQGAEHAHARLTAANAARPGALVLDAAALAPGLYRLELAWTARDGHPSHRTFVIERAP